MQFNLQDPRIIKIGWIFLRLSLKLAPKEATKILKNINTQDKKISKLLNEL